MAKDIHPVDVFVGQRLRQRRISLGITQEDMANALGLSFQQVQKYEKGMNRMSSSRLWEIGRIVGVEVAYFFEGMTDDIAEIKNLRDDLHARAQVAPPRSASGSCGWSTTMVRSRMIPSVTACTR